MNEFPQFVLLNGNDPKEFEEVEEEEEIESLEDDSCNLDAGEAEWK